MRLYPEPLADSLRAVAATVYGVKQEIFSPATAPVKILSIIMRSFVGPQDRVAFPVPTYSLYDTLIAIQQGERITVDYPPDFSVPDALPSQNAALTFMQPQFSFGDTCSTLRTLNDLLARCRVS